MWKPLSQLSHSNMVSSPVDFLHTSQAKSLGGSIEVSKFGSVQSAKFAILRVVVRLSLPRSTTEPVSLIATIW